jgi:uncharacterized repeat protein (TIGR02543 family)
VWKKVYQAYVTYSSNGGTFPDGTTKYTQTLKSYSVDVVGGVSYVTEESSPPTPTKSDYYFNGWATSSSSTEAFIKSGDNVSVEVDKTLNLYAIWTQKPNGLVWIYYGNKWVRAKPWIYLNGWKEVVPWIYRDGSGWETSI